MATFRSRWRSAASLRRRCIGLLAVASLACAPRESASGDVASIQKLQIVHVTPRPDFVGPEPAALEWTAIDGADNYTVSVENEIEIPVFDQEVTTTSIPWPKEVRVEPGTYYWRITGMKNGKIIADSGRAAFVVMEPQLAAATP